MLNSLRAFWPRDYQRGSLWKSHQIGDYLKQAMLKSCPPTESKPRVYGSLARYSAN